MKIKLAGPLLLLLMFGSAIADDTTQTSDAIAATADRVPDAEVVVLSLEAADRLLENLPAHAPAAEANDRIAQSDTTESVQTRVIEMDARPVVVVNRTRNFRFVSHDTERKGDDTETDSDVEDDE